MAELAIGESPVNSGAERPMVLLVEDEPGVRAVAKRVLMRHGYSVIEAESGLDALTVSRTHLGPIHLVVTDAVMPGMSGAETVRRLQEERPDLKVLFMSGHTEDEVLRRGIIGATMPFLQKPFTPDAFARAVRRVLDE